MDKKEQTPTLLESLTILKENEERIKNLESLSYELLSRISYPLKTDYVSSNQLLEQEATKIQKKDEDEDKNMPELIIGISDEFGNHCNIVSSILKTILKIIG